MSIIVAGHLCLDMIPGWEKDNFDNLKPGSTLEVEGLNMATGGAVANTGLALHRLGLPVRMIGKIGDDHTGKLIEKIIAEKGREELTGDLLVEPDEESSYTVVLSPPDTDRIFLHYSGPNENFVPEDIDYELIEPDDIFHFGYPPLMTEMIKSNGKKLHQMYSRAKKRGAITSLDMAMPDPRAEPSGLDWNSLLKRVLPEVDIFLPGLDEILYMLDESEYREVFEKETKDISLDIVSEIARKLQELGCPIVALKLGELGIYLKTAPRLEERLTLSPNQKEGEQIHIDISEWSDRELYIPPFSVDMAGTTGAGDAAVAGFLARFHQGSSPQKALITAAAVGACSVEALDATGGVPSLEKLEERLAGGWPLEDMGLAEKGWYEHRNWYSRV
ncbi:carbohydrate kinase family protein [Halarsenatibacter silvermanii]|uniref:Sugar or nucleoside kinase, ribokinase family n=1 Tax=Halarsenatibacter silvermanii TaxID=321763 RepID=A0A1G9HFH3_9FIRM|nr:carbohydrate kinase family protein [Halarsenatibacter silvermanii]SDL11454.1 Sugar or nucleoside kinase, ribokinase family [Halarsenatibacter silvermanii]